MNTEEQERDERRNRVVIAAGSAIAGVATVVVAIRVSPRLLCTLAGRSQVGSALRSLRVAS
jgi:hypothetical protein